MDIALTHYLVEQNLISRHALERAEKAADESREEIGDVLSTLGLLSEQDLVQSYAALSKVPVVERSHFPEEPVIFNDVPDAFLKSSRILPLSISENEINLAVVNPLDNFAKTALEYVTGKTVKYSVAPASEIAAFYEDSENDDAQNLIDFDGGDGDDLARLKDMASEAPVIRFVNRMMQAAVNAGASDIHIEPCEARLKIRMRLDGMLEDQEDPPAHFKAAIISRIKIIASLDIAERRLPQDGRIRMAIGGRDIDFRVSTTPTAHGESVVLRVLNQHKMVLDPVALGFPARERALFNEALKNPNGIILVTGPTGSGKTTTLYAALKILNQPERKILTIEDPVEYMLEGVNQVQVNAAIDLTFASALRSFLRQDPDIMMVGEIRDLETASIAVQASLTGHLILSTLHTNSAAGAISRLMDMGVEDFLLASTLNIIMAQRLVRKLCVNCKNKSASGFVAVGCCQCQNTGFKGRTMVIEMLEITPEIQTMIKDKASAGEIENLALNHGMRSLEMQAKDLVEQGITSEQEIYRVLGSGGER